MVSIYLIGAIAASLIAFIFAGALSISGWPIAALLLLLMPLSGAIFDLLKFRSNRGQQNYDAAVFSEASVCFRDKWRLWKLQTEWFEDWQETSSEFRLYVGEGEDGLFLFPQKDLAQEQINHLREIFASARQA
jgi:hypothetical protein